MRHHSWTTASRLVALGVCLSILSACGTSSSPSRGRDGATCNDADKRVVSDIMDTARTDFEDGDSVTDHFDFVEAATAPIPESQRSYGAAELMVLLVSVYIQDPDVPSDLQGVQGPVYVVLGEDGKPLAPLGTFSQPFFDLQPPADPGWTTWADALDRSRFTSGLFSCVNPSRR